MRRGCTELTVTAPVALRGGILVHFVARYGIEYTYAVFGVRGRQVYLLNPLPDGALDSGLDLPAWNRFVGRLAPLPDSLLLEYASLIGMLSGNHGFCERCARDSAPSIAQERSGIVTISLRNLKQSIVLGRHRELISVTFAHVAPN